MIARPPPPYEPRRERVLIHVVAKLTGIDYNDNPEINARAIVAANETYHERINDLDWSAAILRRLGYEGPTL